MSVPTTQAVRIEVDRTSKIGRTDENYALVDAEVIRNRLELEALGIIHTAKTTPEGAGRRAEAILLTEEQAIGVCQLSDTRRPSQVRTMLRRMFAEYRQGSRVPVTPDAVAQSTAMNRMSGAIAKMAASADSLCGVRTGFESDVCEWKCDDGGLGRPRLAI